jgi:hypothetical protein
MSSTKGATEVTREVRKMTPVRIADVLRQAPGKWVALKGGQLVAAQTTPDALYLDLQEKHITDATIIRSPGEHEPMLIGLG